MRSRHIPVNEIANKYRGGGHAFASGATLLSLDELSLLLNDIKERIDVYKRQVKSFMSMQEMVKK